MATVSQACLLMCQRGYTYRKNGTGSTPEDAVGHVDELSLAPRWQCSIMSEYMFSRLRSHLPSRRFDCAEHESAVRVENQLQAEAYARYHKSDKPDGGSSTRDDILSSKHKWSDVDNSCKMAACIFFSKVAPLSVQQATELLGFVDGTDFEAAAEPDESSEDEDEELIEKEGEVIIVSAKVSSYCTSSNGASAPAASPRGGLGNDFAGPF